MMEFLQANILNVFGSLANWASSFAIMFGGVVPYIPQYFDIKKTQNCEGFSLYVCLVLLIANTLRILFWFGHWFEMPLLVQSIIMNFSMMMLISLTVSVRSQSQIGTKKERLFTDFDFSYFWEWTDIQSYIEFMLTFTTIGSLVMYLFIDNEFFVETVGFIAVLTESMLGLPQLYKNLLSRSTFGMSRKMVSMWFLGDTFKTIYFYIKRVPSQFFICGCLQIFIDLLIFTQCLVYGHKQRNI